MTFAFVNHPVALGSAASALHELGVHAESTVQDAMPEALRVFMARLRLLEGVPFSHLVPDADLLPLESIRFFHVDREWTDALVEGVLSVGTVTTLDRDQLQALHAKVRAAIDREERRIRVAGGEDRPLHAPAGAISGFLLRSAAVSGWPGLHVRGYRSEVADKVDPETVEAQRVRLLRLERLAPAVLLCLFDGVPQVVHVEEPRQGIQFGVDLPAGATSTDQATIRLRRVDTAAPLPRAPLAVPFRKGAPGVVHVRALASAIEAIADTRVSGGADPVLESDELAIELLQFPFRQVFGPTGDVSADTTDIFRPTIATDRVLELRGPGRGRRTP